HVGVSLDEVAPPHAAATIAGADDGVAAFGARLRESGGRGQRAAAGGGAGHLHELAPGAGRSVGLRHGSSLARRRTRRRWRILAQGPAQNVAESFDFTGKV